MPANSYLQFAFMLMPLIAMLLISDFISRMVTHKLLLSVQRHIERIVGITCMLVGLFAFAGNGWITMNAMRTSLRWSQETWCWSVLLTVSSFLAGYAAQLRSKKGGHLSQLRIMPVELKLSALLVWVMYLLLYEFYFRWLLLPFGKMPVATMWLLNLSAYSILHLSHGTNESIASIPYGILLGVSVMYCGTIWPAFLGHLSLVIAMQFMPQGQLSSNKSSFKSAHNVGA